MKSLDVLIRQYNSKPLCGKLFWLPVFGRISKFPFLESATFIYAAF
jgi:hypothetical protein